MDKKTLSALKRNRAARLASLLTRSYYLKKKGKSEEMYTLICDEFISIGGVYVKFLQGVLLKSEIMKKYNNTNRLRVFEDLDHEPLDIGALLRSELTPAQLSHITLIQPQPFAAGSFGQVYFGQLKDGSQIIIKVLRPTIREMLPFDLKLISLFTKRFFVKLYKNMDLNVSQALSEFKNATLLETDYVHEAAFANELHEAYKDHPTIVIPKTYLGLCTENIIVQNYLDGLSVAHVVKLHEQGINSKEYVKQQIGSDLDKQLTVLGTESLTAIFNFSRIPGDPHPGNIRLLPHDKVGLIDFGIAAHSPADKTALFNMIKDYSSMLNGAQSVGNIFESFIRFFVNDLYRALKRLATHVSSGSASGSDPANFTKDIGSIAESSFRTSTGEAIDLEPMIRDGSILKVLNKMLNKGNRFGLIMKVEASEILRAAQTYMTLVEALGRRNEVLPNVFRLSADRIVKEHPELAQQQEAQMGLGDAIEIVTNWLERVADRDPMLFSELTKRIRMSGEASVET